ncbi:hypothetical protein EHM92_04660 [bacterium]|nr:MAG: hypothetical protein EHM92_04660 [bacterium]
MKQILVAALVALFALSFTIAQDKTAPKEKNTTTTATTAKKKAGCCAEAKGCADMKDCPDMKGTSGASMSKADTTATKSADVK